MRCSAKRSFLVNYERFILLLLYVLVPWTAINLVDYYLLRTGQYDVDSFFPQDRRHLWPHQRRRGRPAMESAFWCRLPFMASPLYTGPWRARWAASIYPGSSACAVTSPAYYTAGQARSQTRAEATLARGAG